MQYIYGIDPGQKGGVVCMDASKVITFYWEMDQWREALDYAKVILREGEKIHFVVEAAQSMPGQGVTSTFSYGVGYGKLLGHLEALEFPYQTVHPRVWTKQMLSGVPADLEKKERNREAFRRLYGEVYRDILSPRSKKPHDGIIDAALIARWGVCNSV